MATLRQIQANRLNAQKSTGPRTLQGKAVSRRLPARQLLLAAPPERCAGSIGPDHLASYAGLVPMLFT